MLSVWYYTQRHFEIDIQMLGGATYLWFLQSFWSVAVNGMYRLNTYNNNN